MNHIVIIGFMGSGKTRVGKRLAQKLGIGFVDVDKIVIKKMGMSVKDIFQKFGEPFYRALETMAVKGLLEEKEPKVISLGAGLPMQEQNQEYLNKLGIVVYIKGSAETLKKRLEETQNPILEGDESGDKVLKLLKQRDPVYKRFANIEVETGIKPFEELVEEIQEKLKAYVKK